MDEFNEGYLDFCIDDFVEYFNDYVNQVLKHTEKYKEVYDEIHELKNNFPKVTAFLENKKKQNLSQKEKDVIEQIFGLEDILHTYEILEAYKLGLKEGVRLAYNSEIPKRKDK